MATITLKNIPELLHQMIKVKAKLHHRSLNSEILHVLEEKLGPRKALDKQKVLDDMQAFHDRLKIPPITTEEIIRMKNEGRA